ncbi:MAG: MraY family glycosyltransferase [Desulfotomaculales bacterium]
MGHLAVSLTLALAVGYLLTPVVGRLAGKLGALDVPDARKLHTRPVPRLGGLAVYLAFLAGLLAFGPAGREIWGLVVGASLIVVLGTLDDIYDLPAKVKLAGQIAAAAAVIPFGLQVEFVTNPLNGGLIHLGWWGIPVTVFWLVAVTNALNLIDGLDGLATGTAVIAAATLAAVAWTEGHTAAVALALIVGAAALGFLRHNFYPAKIFLGDSGSMLLGFVLAATAVIGLTKSTTALSLIIPILILGIPLFDTTLAVVRRCYRRRPIFNPDRGHLHHRLLDAGLTHRRAVLVVYGVDAVLGVSAILLTVLSTDQGVVLLVLLAVTLLTAANKAGVLGRRTQREAGLVEGENHFKT